MTRARSLLAVLAVAALEAGCVDVGPAARSGGVAQTFTARAPDAARRVVAYPRSEYVTAFVTAQPPPLPPPPARDLVAPRPARAAVWIAGHHSYVGRGRYEWVPGHWEVPPADARHFEQPRWEPRGASYVYVRGHWR